MSLETTPPVVVLARRLPLPAIADARRALGAVGGRHVESGRWGLCSEMGGRGFPAPTCA